MKIKGLTGNQLKLIAVLTMTIDHAGMILFPHALWMRMIGRLAYPIFAFMIAEGCAHTRSMPKYLGTIAAFAALFQIVYALVLGSYYQYIFVTFSLSIGLIWLLKKAKEENSLFHWLLVAGGVFGIWFITQILPELLPKTDFRVDYDFLGVMLPVVIWLGRRKWKKLLLAAGVMILMGLPFGSIQMLALAALPLLAMYNGQRGKWNMKRFFYFYYPLHLVLLYGVAELF